MKVIYFVSLILCVVLYFLGVQKVKYMFREEFPETELKKHPWHDIVLIYLKVGLFMICPILNTIMAADMLLDMDGICERTMRNLRSRYSKE